MRRQTFFLSLPPSTNNLFINIKGRGRIKSSEYRSWLTEMGWQLRIQRAQKMQGNLLVYIALKRPKKRRDLDNTLKPILDLLVTHEVIRDDSDIVRISVKWVGKSFLDFKGEQADVMVKLIAFEGD